MLTRLIEMVSLILARSLESDDEEWGLMRSELIEHLQGRGFNGQEIDIAFEVANRIRSRMEEDTTLAFPFKTNLVYKFLEDYKLSKEARGYLQTLIHSKKLTPVQREEIVERALFLDTPVVGVAEVQILANLVLGGEGWPGDDSPSFSYTLQ